MNRLEKQIEKLEVKKKEFDEILKEPEKLSREELTKIMADFGVLIEEIEGKEMRWMELSEFV